MESTLATSLTQLYMEITSGPNAHDINITTSGCVTVSKHTPSQTTTSILWTTIIPPELLLRIFQFACTASPPLEKIYWLSGSEASRFSFPTPGLDVPASTPLTLSWTCRQWRYLVLNTPSLWTAISLGDPDPILSGDLTSRCPLKDIKLLDLFLSRAGDVLPLSFELIYDQLYETTSSNSLSDHVDRTKDPDYFSGIRALALRLIPYRHRWGHVKLNFLLLTNLEPFLTSLAFPYGAPALKYLDISTKFTYTLRESCSLDFSGCPNLTSLKILCPEPVSEAVTRLRDSDSNILANLTNLELRMCQSQTHILAWLSACRNLERVNIKLYDELFTTPPSELLHQSDIYGNGQIVLPRLTDLILHSYCNADPGPRILDALILPNLKNLDIAIWQFWENAVLRNDPSSNLRWPYLKKFLERIPCAPLKRLSLVGTPMSTSEILSVLEVASSSTRTPLDFKGSDKGVCELVLGGAIITDEILESISGTPDKTGSNLWGEESQFRPLLPALESLEIKNTALSAKGIVNLIRSRGRLRTTTSTSTKKDTCSETVPIYDSITPNTRLSSFRTLKRLDVSGSKSLLDNLSSFNDSLDQQKGQLSTDDDTYADTDSIAPNLNFGGESGLEFDLDLLLTPDPLSAILGE